MKKTLFILLAILLCVALIACDGSTGTGGDNTGGDNTGGDNTAKVVRTFTLDTENSNELTFMSEVFLLQSGEYITIDSVAPKIYSKVDDSIFEKPVLLDDMLPIFLMGITVNKTWENTNSKIQILPYTIYIYPEIDGAQIALEWLDFKGKIIEFTSEKLLDYSYEVKFSYDDNGVLREDGIFKIEWTDSKDKIKFTIKYLDYDIDQVELFEVITNT